MKYISTRDIGGSEAVTSAQAIKRGISADGGLYMPENFTRLTEADLTALRGMDYAERAAYIMAPYLPDYSADRLHAMCARAYAFEKFGEAPAKTVRLTGDCYVLELWRGPTCAFKDMALQIMPNLLTEALRITGEDKTALILVATSGDTGKAALEGCRDLSGVRICVFYPEDGVSAMQKLQMQSQEGSNVAVCAVKGNFDDCQNGVKRLFANRELSGFLTDRKCFFSSANSINWGRLLPQVVYYISAYLDITEGGGADKPIDIVVPTGNFGNILAAYIAGKMGLPVGRLLCASNSNNVLTDFFKTGVYDRNRTFFTTVSPSMDILISSNLERLLFCEFGPERCAELMKSLADSGRYTLTDAELSVLRGYFCADWLNEEETRASVRATFESHGYLADTHTAVALGAAERFAKSGKSQNPMLVVSTASAYKFAGDVLEALGEGGQTGFEAVTRLSDITGTAIPAPLAELKGKPQRFMDVIKIPEMRDYVGRLV